MAGHDSEAADSGVPDGSTAPGPIASEDAYAQYYTDSFARHVAWTLKEFKSIARGRTDAEDIVSDAFLELYTHRAEVRLNPDAELTIRIRKFALAYRDKNKKLKSADDSSVEPLDGKIDSNARPADSEYASQECRELFSEEAVATLNAGDRKLYDLYVSGKTTPEISEILGIPYKHARGMLKDIYTKLFDAMSKMTTLGNTTLDAPSLRTPKQAEEAMGRLPRTLSAIVRLTYVDKLSPEQIARQLHLPSARQVSEDLDRGLCALGRIHRVKMPDALVAALAYKPSGVRKDAPE
jgi:RNA polymerase sigma factor (sigma-70 family)